MLISLIGKISFFGGRDDRGMGQKEGLALYEHWEADLRPDLFFSAHEDIETGTAWRLNPSAFYMAIRFNSTVMSRTDWQKTIFRIEAPGSMKWVVASLVDFGPAESTGRSADLSPAIGYALGLETDDYVKIESLNG